MPGKGKKSVVRVFRKLFLHRPHIFRKGAAIPHPLKKGEAPGGYIIGFVFSALLMWLMEELLGRKLWVQALSMVLGLIVLYAFGTV